MADFICPFCNSEKFYKKGIERNRRRYKCNSCRKSIYNYYPIEFNTQKQKKKKPKNNCSQTNISSKKIDNFNFDNDIWDIRSLVSITDNTKVYRFYFDFITKDELKYVFKKYVKYQIISSTQGTARCKYQYVKQFIIYLNNLTSVTNIENISRDIIISFISIYRKNKSNNTIKNLLGALKDFFVTGNIFHWFQVSEYLIIEEDYPKYIRGSSNDIPISVLKQIENSLYKLPEPIARMWIIGYFCAMRLSEIQLCNLDCLKQDSKGNFFISFWRQKNKDWKTLPITKELVKVIQQQQEYIKQQFGDNFNYLFCNYVGVTKDEVNQPNLIPVAKTVADNLLIRCVNCLINSENIKNDNDHLWHFTTHQLRDTRLTHLFEIGHEFAVVSKWTGHKNFGTTRKYVHVKDHTLREETAPIQAALLNIRGEPLNPKDLPETLQTNPNTHTLSIPDDQINTPIYGYCGLSLDQNCPHPKACYTCPSFVASQELLPDYIKVRDLLRDKQTRAEEKGETARVDQFKQQADSLDTVIASFERVA